jgi:hypothetical protein
MNTQKRIEARVSITETGCWVWQGCKNGSGYGVISVGGKQRQAHRVSYEAYNGEIGPAMCILHKCHVRACVNPAHLHQGTKAQNSTDAVRAGTHGKRGPYYDGYADRHKAFREREKKAGRSRIEIVLQQDDVARLDALAARLGTTRAQAISSLLNNCDVAKI